MKHLSPSILAISALVTALVQPPAAAVGPFTTLLGFWAPSADLRVGHEETRAALSLLPTGQLRGSLVAPEKAPELPEHLYLNLESPRANAPRRRVASGRFACPIAPDRSFTCELPAEVLDVALRVPGFVPLYRWDVKVVADEVRDLGKVRLDAGASLAGWAVTESREPLPAKVEARLLPRTTPGGETWMTDRLRDGAATQKVGEDGFFQFAGVAPGSYVVLVEAPDHAPASTAVVEVQEGSETLLEQPVVLRPPLDLEVEIDPPLDVAGRPWILSALRASEGSNAFDRRPFHDGPAGQDGRIVFAKQPPGLYSLAVRDSEGNVFWRDPAWRVETEGDAVRRIEIPIVVVRGEVSLGDEPISAELWFGGRMGPRRIGVETDGEGVYEAVLPEEGDWWLAVTSRESDVKGSLWVEVEPDEDGIAVVDVRLPDTELHGMVLGVDEQPEAHANLYVEDGEGAPITASADGEGRFRIRGLPPGMVQLVATGKKDSSASSALVVSQVQEGAAVGPVVLRLAFTRPIEGVVLSGGLPVAGALVSAMPVTGGTGAGATTDVLGRFELKLRSDVTVVSFEVAPPRGGLTAAQVDVLASAEVVLDTGTDPGTLQIVLPEGDIPPTWTLQLFQDEKRLSGQILSDWLRAHGTPLLLRETRKLELPRMAPGNYRVCYGDLLGESPCTSGFLPPNGSLELSLR